MKVGQGDLLFMCNEGSLVGHCTQDYKCLFTAVTICATLIFPTFDLSILTPLNLKSRSNPRHLFHPCQVHHNPNLVTGGKQVAEIMQI